MISRAMGTPQPKQKLYCYVDESGQDTEGRLFLVAVVVTPEERDEVRRLLAVLEERSGKRMHKWSRSTPRQRETYIQGILTCTLLQHALYYSKYQETRAYVDLTVLSVTKAINTHAAEPYAATILVDGLHRRTEQHRFAHGLRALRIKARKVRGLSDESDAFIRLADALAGFVRDSLAGDERMRVLYSEALAKGVLREV
jgi:Protein of unknown function (DUF3800)